MIIIRLDLLDSVDYNNFKNKKLLQFLKFLVADTYEKRKKEAEGSDILMEFNETVTDYFKDPEFLSKFDFVKRKEEIRYNDGLDDGRLEGRIEGKLEGMLEGKLEGELNEKREIAKKMLARSKPIEEIMEFTELSHEEIKKVQCTM